MIAEALNKMFIDGLNQIFNFFELEYVLEEMMQPSGQRSVFTAHRLKDENTKYVIKLTRLLPYNVSRIQREISILNKIDSHYFPHIFQSLFITQENLENFYDNLNQKDTISVLEDIKKLGINPFFLTIEEYIENISWDKCFVPPIMQTDLVEFLIHIFKALSTLWNLKQAHRDIKPENILITPELTPVIIDLGIAKSLRKDTVDLTMPGVISPHTKRYASLEQLLNQQDNITYKTDQFSIGVISYFLLTKGFPYGDILEIGPGGLIENMNKKKMISIKDHNQNLNDRLCSFIHKLIEIEPYKRYRNSKSILNELKEIKGELE